jgi:hypothetical protein
MASLGGAADAPAFPQDPAEFDSDPRISWSKLDEKFILETEDGQEFEYDTGLKRWVFKVLSHTLGYSSLLKSPVIALRLPN